MRKIKTYKDVVGWGLCIGCGVCYGLGGEGAPDNLIDTIEGIHPHFNKNSHTHSQFLEACPGYKVDSTLVHQEKSEKNESVLIGPVKSIYCGYATDEEVRYISSSGGIITALCLYCLEKEDIGYVIHTGIDPNRPWVNKTVVSRSREELIARSGSRYVASSPCESIPIIERSNERTIFVGKPCDIAAMRKAIQYHPKLVENIYLFLTFFCAGTPSTQGPQKLIEKMGLNIENVKAVSYRGRGWPGYFRVQLRDGTEKTLSYTESWGYIQGFRPLRCHLCPDGLGELSDISSGDAWDRFNEGDIGRSYILIRTNIGNEIMQRAVEAGYLDLEEASASNVIAAQRLIERRKQLHGRLVARRLFGIPNPKYPGFFLSKAWSTVPLSTKFKTLLGTMRRVVKRGLWRRKKV